VATVVRWPMGRFDDSFDDSWPPFSRARFDWGLPKPTLMYGYDVVARPPIARNPSPIPPRGRSRTYLAPVYQAPT